MNTLAWFLHGLPLFQRFPSQDFSLSFLLFFERSSLILFYLPISGYLPTWLGTAYFLPSRPVIDRLFSLLPSFSILSLLVAFYLFLQSEDAD